MTKKIQNLGHVTGHRLVFRNVNLCHGHRGITKLNEIRQRILIFSNDKATLKVGFRMKDMKKLKENATGCRSTGIVDSNGAVQDAAHY